MLTEHTTNNNKCQNLNKILTKVSHDGDKSGQEQLNSIKDKGFVKMYRALMDQEIFKDDPYSEYQAFEWLGVNACYGDRQEFNPETGTYLDAGQIATSVRYMARAWNWGDDNTAISKVHRFIKKMVKAGYLKSEKSATQNATQAQKAPNTITICNYSDLFTFVPEAKTANATQNATNTKETYYINKINNKKNPYRGNQSPEPEVKYQGVQRDIATAGNNHWKLTTMGHWNPKLEEQQAKFLETYGLTADWNNLDGYLAKHPHDPLNAFNQHQEN